MKKPAHDFIDELVQGYQASQILMTANRLGLFAALGDETKGSRELAELLEADLRGVRILCNALLVLGLLDRQGDGYSNSELARRHLLPDSSEPRTHSLQHGSRQYERWGRLFDAVKTGRPAADETLDPRLAADASRFARAMADVGRRSAAVTLDQLDLSHASRLLDIGGGPAIYAIEFAQRWPQLDITVLDSAETLAVARENIEEQNLQDRIHTRVGDAREDPLAGPYDAIFISNVLHIYSAVDNRHLVQRCADNLASGGQLILKDFFLEDDLEQTPGGAIFAVNMLVSTEAGDCYSVCEARRWLDDAGLDYAGLREIASRSRLLIARKP